jgi:hypothetical protein
VCKSVQICVITDKEIFRSTLFFTIKRVHIVSIFSLNLFTFIPDMFYKSYIHFLVIIEQNYSLGSNFVGCSKFWVLTLGGLNPNSAKAISNLLEINFMVDPKAPRLNKHLYLVVLPFLPTHLAI